MAFKVTVDYGDAQNKMLEVWTEGPHAALGTIHDLVRDLSIGRINKVTLESTQFRPDLRPVA